MSSAAAPSSLTPSAPRTTPYFTPKLLATTAILLVAAAFVVRYVFRYYLHYNEPAFTDPVRGAANYWVMRGWLLMHMSGGMLAIVTGPFQFWTGFRARYARVHRFMGYCFLAGVGIGVVGAVRMAINTSFGWPSAVWLLALATTSMAFYAILKRKIAVHKEWMVRAYVVTFAFVTFRILNDFPPLSRIQPASDRANMIGWACWSIPLLFTEVVLQLRRMSSPGPRL